MAVDKTPVVILHEMMMKLGDPPIYELCPNELPTITSIFTVKVTCDGLTAHGTGRSKKEAKQNAAKVMIEKMSTREVIINGSVSTESTEVRDNIIQKLMKLCNKLCLEDPIYNYLEATGPAHARTYKTQCIVSKYQHEGSGRSKKQSKQYAAKKMIEQLKDTFNINDSPIRGVNKKIKRDYNGVSNDINNTNFSPMGKVLQASKLKINYQLKMQSERKELHKSLGDSRFLLLKNLEEMDVLIAECQFNYNIQKISELKQMFQKTMDKAKIDFHHMLLETNDPTTSMLIIQLNIVPDVIEMSIGKTREEAEWRTISKVASTLRELLN